jgi:hypothetical protein
MATLMFIKILCIRTVYELTPYYRKRGGIMIVIDKPLVRYNLEIPRPPSFSVLGTDLRGVAVPGGGAHQNLACSSKASVSRLQPI